MDDVDNLRIKLSVENDCLRVTLYKQETTIQTVIDTDELPLRDLTELFNESKEYKYG